MDANNDCRRNITGLECIRKECMQPNAWFHWAHAVDDASKWAAASTYINYDIVMPETSKQAIQLFRRTNVVEEWWLLLIGVCVTSCVVVGTKWVVKNNDRFGIITKGTL